MTTTSTADTTGTAATSSGTTGTTDVPATTGGGSATTASGGPVDLAAVCPDPIVIQTDWFPEAEHGALYEMVGEGYEVDVDKKVVSGPLVASGQDTGVTIEVRTGGPAIGEQTVAAVTYADDSITLAYANTEAQVLQHDETPLISVVAPLEINPQIIYWDPETYPDVQTLADLGEENITINVFPEECSPRCSSGTARGTPIRSIRRTTAAPPGSSPRTGRSPSRASPRPSHTPTRTCSRSGASPSPSRPSTTPGSRSTRRRSPRAKHSSKSCGRASSRFVPIIQQAAIDFVTDPVRANAIIVDAVAQYDTFWVYDEALATFSVETQRELGLVGNGPDDTLGNMEEERIQTVIDQIRDDAGLDVPAELVAADLFTNEFIDPDIGL